MKLFSNLKRTISLLEQYPQCWAVCGGIAACIYRDTPRFTGDIDIILSDFNSHSALNIANDIAIKLGYKPTAGWVTGLDGQLIRNQALVVGREDIEGNYIGIDFLLPVMPWISDAVKRAQSNLLDYGFKKVPTITIEDLIIAKLYAYQGTPSRITDLDDIRSILRNQKQIDLLYIKKKIGLYGIDVPTEFSSLI